jgi:hypothetical protein
MTTATENTGTGSRRAGRTSARKRAKSAEPRNPRTYYAKSADGKILYRFKHYKTREQQMPEEGLLEVQALDARQMKDRDPDLKIVHRDEEPKEPVVETAPEREAPTAKAASTAEGSTRRTTTAGSSDPIRALFDAMRPHFEELLANSGTGPNTGRSGKNAGNRPIANH